MSSVEKAYCRAEASRQVHFTGFLFPSNCFYLSLLLENPQQQLRVKGFEKVGVQLPGLHP
ncbi:hypothetical protein P7K49_008580, partial [Saguinus oedipus]